MGPFATLILDCDGVTVDSEPSASVAWVQSLDNLGLSVGHEEIAGFVGRTEREMAEYYGPIIGVGADDVEAAARSAFLSLMSSAPVVMFDDVVALLDRWGHRPVAIASNSPRWRLDSVLAAARVPVEITISADEVAAPKPAPDIYLAALDVLEADPGSTLVVEDTPTGISAAKMAGCTVVAVVRGAVSVETLRNADLIVDDLASS